MPINNNPKLKEYRGDEGKIPSQTNGDGFIEIIDDNFDKTTEWGENFDHNKKGKWVLHFEKGSNAIDEAWQKVKQGVADGVFMEAKFAMQNDEFDDQVIVIYTYDHENTDDVVWVHDEITKRGINIGATKQLAYISDAETRKADEEQRAPVEKTIQEFAPYPSELPDTLISKYNEENIALEKTYIESQNANLAAALSDIITVTRWESNVDGISCEVEYKVKEDDPRETAENDFKRRLSARNIDPRNIQVDSSKRSQFTDKVQGSNVAVFAKVTSTSSLLKLRTSLESSFDDNEEYRTHLEQRNADLAAALSIKTHTQWSSNVNGVYCKAGFKIGDDVDFQREEAERIFQQQLNEIGIDSNIVKMDSSMRGMFTDKIPGSNVVVTASVTLTSNLLNLSKKVPTLGVRRSTLGNISNTAALKDSKLINPEDILNELKKQILEKKWVVEGLLGGMVILPGPGVSIKQPKSVPRRACEMLEAIMKAQDKNNTNENRYSEALEEIRSILAKTQEKGDSKFLFFFGVRDSSTADFYKNWNTRISQINSTTSRKKLLNSD